MQSKYNIGDVIACRCCTRIGPIIRIETRNNLETIIYIIECKFPFDEEEKINQHLAILVKVFPRTLEEQINAIDIY